MKKKVKKFLALSVLGLIFVNLTFVSAAIIVMKYGRVTLNPGEKYILNIPFLGISKSSQICGTAEKPSGGVSGVTVNVYNKGGNEILRTATTDTHGNYCITLPEEESTKVYDINISFDNVTQSGEEIRLGSNNYTIEFDEDEEYSLLNDDYVFLSGKIYNEHAEIDNGRIEIKLSWYPNSSDQEEIFDYKTYYIEHIDSEEIYEFPNDELNINWSIPSEAKPGKYKFLYKTSFNGKEKSPSSGVFFNLTE